MSSLHNQNKTIYSVSELNRDVRTLLETGFPLLWIEGEISNFAAPSSGHWYFSLKDEFAQVRCAMFKNRNKSIDFSPGQGDKVLIKARISLYEARGEYQLIAEDMEEAGFGALQRAFEALKKRLEKEGLFNPTVKKSLPALPKQIGVITSPTGAAIRDILSVLKRRYPAIPILIYPVQVQGDAAAGQIASSLYLASEQKHCDLIILARGGGSLEDLWAFNEEVVARAIFHCDVPVISAIGHEIDTTIADFVADKRAATPSAAAELATPSQDEVLNTLSQTRQLLTTRIKQRIQEQSTSLRIAQKRLKHPAQRLIELSQRLDELEIRLVQSTKHQLTYKSFSLAAARTNLLKASPKNNLQNSGQKLSYLSRTLYSQFSKNFEKKVNQLKFVSRSLNTVSPLATMERGYAIVSQTQSKDIIRSIKEIKTDDKIEVRLKDGKAICKVTTTRNS